MFIVVASLFEAGSVIVNSKMNRSYENNTQYLVLSEFVNFCSVNLRIMFFNA